MTDTTLEPPPERELPPGQHGALRARLLQQIDDRPPRSRSSAVRRRLVPLIAAAAVLAVIACVVTVLVSSREKPTPTVTKPAQLLIDPVVPGYSNDELKTIKQACLTATRAREKGSQGFGRPKVDDSIDVSSLRVYNVAVSRFGAMALLYGTDGEIACNWFWPSERSTPPAVSDLTAKTAVGEFTKGSPQWLYHPISVDLTSFTTSSISKKSVVQVGGRVPSNVARIEVTVVGRTQSISPVNGTYIALVAGTRKNDSELEPQIRAYDRANHLLATYNPDENSDTYCVVTPKGERLIGKKNIPLSKCTVAVPWR